MWRIYYGPDIIGDPRLELPIVDKELDLALNQTGSLAFTLLPQHEFCGKIELLQKAREVRVEQDGETVFCGRAMSAEQAFDGSIRYTCEGERGYLNDAILPAFNAGSGGVPQTASGLFNWMIARYNDSMPEAHRFVVGINQGDELAARVDASGSEGARVWETMRSVFVDGAGGYIRVRHDGSRRYIDLLASGDKVAAQRIRFGENLLDFSRRADASGYCTRVRAIGGTPEGAGAPVTLDVLGHRALQAGYELDGGWVIDIKAEKAYGVVEGFYEDSGITDAEALLRAASRWLANVRVGDTLELTALDLSTIDATIKPIRIGDYVRATSKPHGFDEWFICTQRSYDLDAPENDKFVLGSEYDTLTGAQSKKLAELNASIQGTAGKIEEVDAAAVEAARAAQDARDAADEAQEAADSAQQAADGKATIYSEQPSEYKANDLWVQAPTDAGGTANILVAVADSSGSYSASDWERASDYTNDAAANAAQSTANTAQSTASAAQTTANAAQTTANSAATAAADAQAAASALATRVTTAETNIEQNQHDIALKANSSDVYTKTQTDGLISTEVTNRNAAITTASDAITASVAETYATKTEAKQTDSGSGRSVAADSASKLMGLTVYGESVQDGTPTPEAPVLIQTVSPANALHFPTWAEISDSSVPISGGYRNWTFKVLPSTTYYLFTSYDNDYVGNQGGYALVANSAGNANWLAVSHATGGVKNGTITSGSDGILYLNVAGTQAQYEDTVAHARPMLVVSSTGRSTPYVPDGCIGVLSHGKNLFLPKLQYRLAPNSGVAKVIADNGTVTASNTARDDRGWSYANADFRLQLDPGSYIVTVVVTTATTVSSKGIVIYSSSGTSLANYGSDLAATGTYTHTLTLSDKTDVGIMMKLYTAAVKIQIEKGPEATDYEAPIYDLKAIDLRGNVLASLPDGTKDVLDVDSAGHVTIKKNTGEIVYDGSEAWQPYSAWDGNGQYCYYRGGAGAKGTTVPMCSHLACYTRQYFGGSEKPTDACTLDTAGNVTVRVAQASSNDFKTWLTSNNITVAYQLATAQAVDLGYIGMPEMSDGSTVEVIASLTPSIDASWWTSAGAQAAEAYSTASAMIRVQAGEIEQRVEKDGVIASINLSAETSGGSALKINADKITFDGTAIFNASKSQFDSHNDARYDEIGEAVSKASAAQAAAINESKSYTDDAVADIEVGGRNLLLWTGEMPIAARGTGNTVADKSGVCGWASWWPVSTNDGVKTEYTGSNPQQCIGFPLANNGSVKNGDEVVLTFEARGNLTSFGQFYWIQLTGANIALNFTPTGPALSETEWNKYTFVPDTTSANVRTCSKVLIYYGPGNAAGKWIELRKGSVKLEKGNKATGWTPAPEDTIAAINAANDKEQLIYRSAASGTTSMSGTTTWVTDATGGQNKWTVVRPEYSSSYPVLFVATQRQTVGGTVTCTTPAIDATTTVIDGGNIITNSITADKIAANSLTIGKINMSDTSTASAISNSVAAEDATNKANAVKNSIISMGEQLVANGSAYLRNNTNFSMFTYDGAKANFSGGSFTRSVGSSTVWNDDYIPVDTSKSYRFAFDAISASGNAKTYGCIYQLDIDGNSITAANYLFVKGSTTTLAQELKRGDTTVYLTSVQGFDNGPSGANVNGVYSRSLIFWDWMNSKGYTYPQETYSRHRSGNGLWADHSSIDYTNNKITISAWNMDNVPAGTPVSQGNSGGTYLYVAASSVTVPNTWKTYAGYILPPGSTATGLGTSGAFWPGTAKVRVGWLWNYQHSTSSPQSQMWVTNVSLTEANPSDVYYGVGTSTDGQAGTGAKVVNVPGLFSLVAGARVTVKFSTANTAAAPTLNVNGTGAKAIWFNNAVASSSNPVLWGANATLNFVYDGAEWVLDEKPPSYFAACSTPAATRDKEATVAGALVVNGTTLTLNCSTANTYASASVRVNLSSTGVKDVYLNRTVTSATNKLLWAANSVFTFVQSGGAWALDDNGLRKYVTHIDDNGISVHPASTTANRAVVNATGLEIFKDNVSVAKYGDTQRVGKSDKSHLEADYHSLQLIDKEGNAYFYASDLRNEEGIATVTETVTAPANQSYITVGFVPRAVVEITSEGPISGTVPNPTINNRIDISPTPTRAVSVTVTYTTSDPQVKAYTFGTRTYNSNVGGMSVAEGSNNTASGTGSHAEGSSNQAVGFYTHAEGTGCYASGTCAHAEGNLGHASGNYSHAEGYDCIASGDCTHAQGKGTYASVEGQTSLGTYNIVDLAGRYVVIVGNGATDSARSNAFAIRWNGTVEVQDSVTAAMHSITPVVLYDNDSNTSQTITLSETSANFERLTICYKMGGDNNYSSMELWHPNGKSVSLTANRPYNAGTVGVWNKSSTYTVSGNKIALKSGDAPIDWYIDNGTAGTVVQSSNICITQVIGYRSV